MGRSAEPGCRRPGTKNPEPRTQKRPDSRAGEPLRPNNGGDFVPIWNKSPPNNGADASRVPIIRPNNGADASRVPVIRPNNRAGPSEESRIPPNNGAGPSEASRIPPNNGEQGMPTQLGVHPGRRPRHRHPESPTGAEGPSMGTERPSTSGETCPSADCLTVEVRPQPPPSPRPTPRATPLAAATPRAPPLAPPPSFTYH